MVENAAGARPKVDRRVVTALTTLGRIGSLRKKINHAILAGELPLGSLSERVAALDRGLPTLVVHARLRRYRRCVSYRIALLGEDHALHGMLLLMLAASRRAHRLRSQDQRVILFELQLNPVCEALLDDGDTCE